MIKTIMNKLFKGKCKHKYYPDKEYLEKGKDGQYYKKYVWKCRECGHIE